MGTVSIMGDEQVAQLIADLTQRGLTIATAESLTGGGLVARLVDVPGASHVVRGGACTYAVDTKSSVLGVSESRLSMTGPVDEEVARQMARGARSLFGADIGVSTTGVAGPGPADGFEAGTVHIACAHPAGRSIDSCTLRVIVRRCARVPLTQLLFSCVTCSTAPVRRRATKLHCDEYDDAGWRRYAPHLRGAHARLPDERT